MFHNFTFVENDTTHYLKWNPTSVRFGTKERTVRTPLDGPPIIHYQDTTEVLGQFVWENVPVKWRTPYEQIESFVGKTGYIYTNKMPELVGQKNLLLNSSIQRAGETGYWSNSNVYEDGSTYGPDGISLVYFNKSQVSAPNRTIYASISTPIIRFAEHNVISCYIKYGNTDEFALNMYSPESPVYSHISYFNFSNGGATLTGGGTHGTEYGFEKVPNSDNWFRVWCYLNTSFIGDSGIIEYGRRCRVYIYQTWGWVATDQIGTYVTDIQLEQGVTRPTWFAKTTGTAIDEPLQVEFLDMQTEYTESLGVVKHNLVLNFKLIGDTV